VAYDGGKVVRLPKGVHYVTPLYISDCLAHGQLLPEERYYIDLYRMAVLRSLQEMQSEVSANLCLLACLLPFTTL
jgi:hypothetical protein